jgi:hypothetical protein
MANDLEKLCHAETISSRAKLKNNLIHQFIIECLCLHKMANIEEITLFVEAQVNYGIEWRASNAADLFVGNDKTRLIHPAAVARAIEVVNTKLAAIENTNPENEVVLAKIHKLAVEHGAQRIEKYVLIHNWTEV